MNRLRDVPAETAKSVSEELRQVANSLLWCMEVGGVPEMIQVRALERLAKTLERATAPHLQVVSP